MEKIRAMDWGDDLLTDVSNAVILLGDSLGGMPKHAALKEAVMTKLLDNLGAVTTFVGTDAKFDQWCKLTWPVVLTFLQDPRVTTDCEDTVVCAVDTWLCLNAAGVDSPLYKQVQTWSTRYCELLASHRQCWARWWKADSWTIKRHWRFTKSEPRRMPLTKQR
jgi:hypothetical protein